MIDSGATALFIHQKFVDTHQIRTHQLPQPIGLQNINGTSNQAGAITHFVRLRLTIGTNSDETEFLVTDIGSEKVILGLPWLKKVNPKIDWVMGELELPGDEELNTPLFNRIPGNRGQRRVWLKAGVLEHATDELWSCATMSYSTDIAAKANKGKSEKTFEEMVPPEYHRHAKVFSEAQSMRLPQHQP